jgi:hypothetical protein
MEGKSALRDNRLTYRKGKTFRLLFCLGGAVGFAPT